MMNWRRACWSNCHDKLFGSRKDRYSLQSHRLQLHVNNWCGAIRAEVLIDRSKLEERAIILSRNNDAIAKWLDRRYEDRAKSMKAIDQRTGQTSILRFTRSANNRQYNYAFQTCQQEARRAALPTSSNTVDGDQSSEEPPGLNSREIRFIFPLLHPSFTYNRLP